MKSVIVVGAGGTIGRLVVQLLAAKNYMVYAIDTREGGPVSDTNICYLKANALHNVAYQELLSLRGRDFYGEIKAIVSCLPYDKTLAVAKIAHEYNISY